MAGLWPLIVRRGCNEVAGVRVAVCA